MVSDLGPHASIPCVFGAMVMQLSGCMPSLAAQRMWELSKHYPQWALLDISLELFKEDLDAVLEKLSHNDWEYKGVMLSFFWRNWLLKSSDMNLTTSAREMHAKLAIALHETMATKTQFGLTDALASVSLLMQVELKHRGFDSVLSVAIKWSPASGSFPLVTIKWFLPGSLEDNGALKPASLEHGMVATMDGITLVPSVDWNDVMCIKRVVNGKGAFMWHSLDRVV